MRTARHLETPGIPRPLSCDEGNESKIQLQDSSGPYLSMGRDIHHVATPSRQVFWLVPRKERGCHSKVVESNVHSHP